MNETENIKAITNFLFIEDDFNKLRMADLVIILCNNNINGIAEKVDSLFKKNIINRNSLIIISGNHGVKNEFQQEECILVQNILVDKYGYNKKIFVLEKESTNIYENLLYSKRLVDDINKYDNILIIGAAFALRRIKLCASGMDYPVDKIQFVGTVNKERRNCGKDNWWKTEPARVRVYQELERIGKYLVKGDLDIK